MSSQSVAIPVSPDSTISALLQIPAGATACLVLAHGAGAGMTHQFLSETAVGLAERGVATLRYQFPYMQQGRKRPDIPAVAQVAVRAAVAEAALRCPGLPLFAGGKSFGGRMTSQAQAAMPLPGVRGLIFFGFPLHQAGKPSTQRAAHLVGLTIPLLFLQGARDTLAESDLIASITEQIGPSATLVSVPLADHSFHVPVHSGRTDAAVLADVLDSVCAWISQILASA